MPGRIQYVLFVLLFMALGAVEPASQRSGTGDRCASLSEESTLHLPDAVRGCFDVSFDCAVPVEVFDSVPGQKDLARPRADVRLAASGIVPSGGLFRLPEGGYYPRPKDYYVYSLERMLI